MLTRLLDHRLLQRAKLVSERGLLLAKLRLQRRNQLRLLFQGELGSLVIELIITESVLLVKQFRIDFVEFALSVLVLSLKDLALGFKFCDFLG